MINMVKGKYAYNLVSALYNYTNVITSIFLPERHETVVWYAAAVESWRASVKMRDEYTTNGEVID